MEYEEYVMRRRGRVTGLIGAILTVMYTITIASHFAGIFMEDIGSFVATMLLAPHMICVVMASVFSCVGFFARKRWAMLTAAMLMSVSAVLFLSNAFFVIVPAVFLFVSYVRMCNTSAARGEWRSDPAIPALKAAFIIPFILFVVLMILIMMK